MVYIIAIAIVWIVYMVLTKDMRAEKKEQQRREFEQKKKDMSSDVLTDAMADAVVKVLTDLKGGAVMLLRDDLQYYLLFNKGSVFVETRWTERVSENNFEKRKNTNCILDRLEMGKNHMTDEENYIFKEIVFERLKKIPWLDVRNSYSELTVKKAKNATIPEA